MTKKGERTKQQILETTAELFWKNSYHKVKIDTIVKVANVNKASFYQYFKNKEDAADKSINYMFEQTKEHLFEASFKKHTHPIKRLEEIFNLLYLSYTKLKDSEGKIPGCPFVNMGSELATENTFLREKIELIFEDFYTYHQTIYTDAQKMSLTKINLDPKDMGRYIQGILNGATTSAKIRNNPKDILDALIVAKIVMGLSS